MTTPMRETTFQSRLRDYGLRLLVMVRCNGALEESDPDRFLILRMEQYPQIKSKIYSTRKKLRSTNSLLSLEGTKVMKL